MFVTWMENLILVVWPAESDSIGITGRKAEIEGKDTLLKTLENYRTKFDVIARTPDKDGF